MELKEKIDFIYEKIARKDLSFGCRFQGEKSSYVIQDPHWCFVWWDWWIYNDRCDTELNTQIKVEKIIGHPVMIGDVIDYINEDIFLGAGYDEVFYHSWESVVDVISLWEEKRKPIEEQDDECVNFIFNLISKK